MTAITFVPSLLKDPVRKKINNFFMRTGYSQAAYELDRHGMHKEAQRLRNDAKLVGVN